MTSETFESGSAAPEMAPVADKVTAARNSLVINVLLVSTFVVMLNETAMSVAIPKLMAALQVDASAAQWLTTAFLLTMAVVIPVTGFLLVDALVAVLPLASEQPTARGSGRSARSWRLLLERGNSENATCSPFAIGAAAKCSPPAQTSGSRMTKAPPERGFR